MKKYASLIAAGALLFSAATVFAYTFPSTNELNKNKQVPGRIGQDAPYVNQDSVGVGEVTLEFVNDSNSLAFFEYRIQSLRQRNSILTFPSIEAITPESCITPF